MSYQIRILAVTLAGTLSLNCSGPTDPPTPPKDYQPPAILSESERALATSATTFGLKLFSAISAAEPADKNICVSPLSISYALGMVLNGAQGATFSEIAHTLELGDLTLDEINQSYRDLMLRLIARDPVVEVGIANSIWYRQSAPVLQSFTDVNREFFNALVREIDFQATWAADTINNWVELNTNGMIESIVAKPIDPNVLMILLNAVYFKGTWTIEFDTARTESAEFQLEDGSSVAVDMMRQDTIMSYFQSELLQAVSLPYGEGSFAMTVLLPLFGHSVNNIMAELTPANWNTWLGSLADNEVELWMPRFKFEFEAPLNDVLKALGMPTAFTPAADFSEIVSGGGIWIDKVNHKTFIQVDESGTEAAAVTSIVVVDSATVPIMQINRPFVFVIHERDSGAILFIGRVANPT